MKTNEEYRLLEQQLAERDAQLLKNADLLGEAADALAHIEKQNVLLRDALQSLVSARAVKESAGKTPEYEQMRIIAWGKATLALDATADLGNYIICDAVPISYIYKHRSSYTGEFIWKTQSTYNGNQAIATLPLYKAKELK